YGTVDVSDSLSLELGDGVLASVAATGMVPLHDIRVERCAAFGSAGHVQLDAVAETLTLQLPREAPLVLVDPQDGTANPLLAPATALVHCRMTGEEPLVPGAFGASVVEATWAAAESARRGEEVDTASWRKAAE
ncbi:MAG: hypothetical protein VB036_12055, partial [Propionicimonas sp.]|nr:hypothetical protein [Propionicimonas sp.]